MPAPTRLIGGTGDDWLCGGAGSDAFDYNTREFDNDTIADFNADGGDKIDLAFLKVGDLASLQPSCSRSARDVVITLGYDGTSEASASEHLPRHS